MRQLLAAAVATTALLFDASAQDCIYVPDNNPTSGPVSTMPFGSSTPSDPQTANQHLLVRIPMNRFPQRKLTIREIGFAPVSGGTRELKSISIGLGTIPAGTPLDPVFFRNHPGFGAGVQSGVHWDWRTTRGQWNHLGWRESFPFDPTSNRDLIVEITVTGGGLTSGTPDFYMDPSLDHVFASGFSGTPPARGVVGIGAPKMKICFDLATAGVFGQGCAGTRGLPTLQLTGSTQLGSALGLQLGNLPANGIAILVADPRVSTAQSDLSGFGMPGCRQYVYLPGLVSAPLTMSANGTASLSLPIPTTANNVGSIVFMQVFAFDPGANALGVINTPAAALQIGS